MTNNFTRLLESLIPSHYDVTIIPSLDKTNFEGSVIIKAKLAKDSTQVTLHSVDLTLLTATVNGLETTITYDTENETVTLSTPNTISAGAVTIAITFKAEVTKQLHGIYPSTYTDEGVEKVMLATQLESHHAREVLPCIDEPAAKAVFELTLRVKDGEVGLSNTPVASSDAFEDGGSLVRFEATPIMSSYLLAFVTGELASKSSATARGVEVSVWSTPNQLDSTSFALKEAVDCLEFYEKYFEIDYPLAKCDLIALPDFVTGAMENWGCITFRETAMLVDENTSQRGKQWVAEVVAHELAHQWFGNLVTMDWWSDLWLNEGFASWIASLAVDDLHPEWNVWTDFVISDIFRGQDLDALESSHPIEVAIENPDEIRSIFDAISYSKGGSVLRMLHSYMGAESFRKGLHLYLNKHAYKNAQTKDLWASLEESSGKNITQFMDPWTSEMGFPYVSVTSDDAILTLKQEKFNLSQNAQPSNQVWPIPLFNKTDQLMEQQTIQLAAAESPLLLNNDRQGFYFTSYDQEHIERHTQTIKNKTMSVLNRLGILHETNELTKANKQSIESLMTLLAAYNTEDDAHVWSIISGVIADITRVFYDEKIIAALKSNVLTLVKDHADRLGMTPIQGEEHNETLLRPIVNSLASWSGHQPTIDACHKLYKNPKTIHADSKATVLATVARDGDQTVFDQLLQMHINSISAQEKTKLASALTSFKDPVLFDQALALIKSDHIRSGDVYHWIAYSFQNKKNKDMSWKWLQQNWTWLEETFRTDIATFAHIPKFSAMSYASKDFLKEYDAFYTEKKPKGIQLQIDQGHETVLWQSDWRERDIEKLRNFLQIER